jgi:beta-mannosidase
MLWWNLRDGWPIFSDAVVDYYGRKKLAYEYIRRVQTDVCVFCGEADAPTSASASGTTDATPKRRPTRMLKPGLHPLIVVNDTLVPVAGKVAVKDADTGDPLFAEDFTVERNGKAVLGSIPAPTKPAMWLLDWTLDGGTPRHNHYLAGPRPFSLAQYKNWLKKLGLAILDFGF